LLENVTRLAPRYAPAWLRLADLRFKQGQTAAAARAYRERLALLPRDPYARLGLARVDWQEGRRPEARGELEQIAVDAPQFAPAQNLLAELLTAEGDEAGAKRARRRGRDAGRFREAEDPWLDELADWCFDYDRLCIRGTIENQTKHGDRGRALFERAIRLRPAALPAYELLGGMYLEINDGAKARAVFERALADATAATPSAHVYVNLSRAHRLLRQPAEAVRVCREGLARLGDAPELYDALGSALLELGEREQAIAALRRALAGPSVAASANYSLAVALIAGGQLDDAMAALHRALAAEPAYPPALSLLAQVEIDSGHWLDALKYLRPLYESHPELPEARAKMADYYLHAGAAAEQAKNFAEAEQHYRAGCAIDAGKVELQARLGVLCLLQRRFSAAVDPLEAYHRLAPEDPRAALFLGQAYVAVGRRDDARRILTRGAELAANAGNTETAQHCQQILRLLR
jgi:HemY protein